MIGFFLKKNFADIWDNLFHIFVVNFFLMIVIFAGVGLEIVMASLFVDSTMKLLFTLIWLCVFLVLACVVLFAEGKNISGMANFESGSIKTFFSSIVPNFKMGAMFGLFLALLTVILVVSVPYYFTMWLPRDGSPSNLLGLVFLSLIFWFMVISLLSLQWFPAIYNLMGNNFVKCLKKSYILFFDNTGFSLFLAFVNLLQMALTIITFGLIPGLNGINLTCTNALRLLLYKYDWIEVNPTLTRKEQKDVPWDDLLVNDRRTLGPRTLRSFIFPWKD